LTRIKELEPWRAYVFAMCETEELRKLASRYRVLASEVEETAREMPPSKWQAAYCRMARHFSELADEIDTVLYAPDNWALLN
jgi:hypothetical protein